MMLSIAPMTLANMRANGVRRLAVYCGALGCHHEAVLDVSSYPDELPVPAFGPRMVCTVCGAIGADARPNWQERAAIGALSADKKAPAVRPGLSQE
jgi:hypothetical protein